jgi:hypothetical protein
LAHRLGQRARQVLLLVRRDPLQRCTQRPVRASRHACPQACACHECAPLRRMRRAVLRQSPKVGVRREATTLASAVRCESSTQCSCSAPPVERPLRTSTCCSCCLSSARSLSRSLSLSERALHSGAL